MKFEVISNTGEFEFQLTEQIFDRGPAEVNIGGLSMAEAREIQLGEVIQGNVHVKEGNQSNGGGQWYKFTIQPGQAVSTSGTILGGPIMGTSFGMVLWSGSGVQLATLGQQWAPDGEFEFPMEATFNYIYTYTHTGTSPETVYLQVFSSSGITHEFAFRVREVMMKFTILSQTIDPTNNYSEDTLVKVESVWGPDEEPLVEFTKSNLQLLELQTAKINFQNGGTLPLAVNLSRGTTEFSVRSLAGPDEDNYIAPEDGKLVVKLFRTQNPEGYLKIPQWWTTDQSSLIHQLAEPDNVPAWMQYRIRDLFDSPLNSPQLNEVLSAVSHYHVEHLFDEDPQTQKKTFFYGKALWQSATSSPIVLNPFFDKKIRLDSSGDIELCGMSGRIVPYLSSTVIHEARHCFQARVAALEANDTDADMLPISTPASWPGPHHITADNTISRTVCDMFAPLQSQLLQHSFLGPQDYDSDSSLAYEFDATCFESSQATGPPSVADPHCQ